MRQVRQLSDVPFRGPRQKVVSYDYKTSEAPQIPHQPRRKGCVLEVLADNFGVQNVLNSLKKKEQKSSAVVLAGNSGLPGGAVGLHMKVIGDIRTSYQLKSSPKSGSGTYGTQEEDVVKNWILSEKRRNQTPISESMDLIFNEFGMLNYNDQSPMTIQGVNFKDLLQSSCPILDALERSCFPPERLYADALVVRNTYLRPKRSRKPDTYYDSFVKTSLVFVAGPNVGACGQKTNSTTRRTFNQFLSNNENKFLEAVKWTYYAALHSIAMEGKRVALLPWISGDLYAGDFKGTYGTRSDGKELQKCVNSVLDMQCNFAASRNCKRLRHAFDRVIVVHMNGPCETGLRT